MNTNNILQEVRMNIMAYLQSLDKNEYPNISDLLSSETMANRLVDDLFNMMLKDSKLSLEDATDQIEISLSIQ